MSFSSASLFSSLLEEIIVSWLFKIELLRTKERPLNVGTIAERDHQSLRETILSPTSCRCSRSRCSRQSFRSDSRRGRRSRDILLRTLSSQFTRIFFVREWERIDLFRERWKVRWNSSKAIAKGSRFLFGSVVGGAAGALAKVSSSASKGLATLTLDKDYQNIRIQRKELIPQSKSTTDLLAAGKNTGKVSGSMIIHGVDCLSFLQDFVMGVKGLVKKPLQGAKRKGNKGLVKGLGKGFLGLFARPTSALADLTSQSFNYVKRSFSRRSLSFRHEEIYLELSIMKRLFIGFVNLDISGEIDWFDLRLLMKPLDFISSKCVLLSRVLSSNECFS